MAGKTTHHCIHERKGNCILDHTPKKNIPYCNVHMTYCKHPECDVEYPYSLGSFQKCRGCEGREKKKFREAAAAKAVADKKAKEEKAAKAKADAENARTERKARHVKN